MRAIEFKSKIKNNKIQIPTKVQSELKSNHNKDVRVIVLFDESDANENIMYQEIVKNHFLEGYAVSDSVYDNY